MERTDITARKHGGVQESADANPAEADKYRDRVIVLGYVIACPNGVTSKEVAASMGKPLNAISGRFSELQKSNQIQKSGLRRDGCAVWVPYVEPEQGQKELF
jgi:hypothetical protein